MLHVISLIYADKRDTFVNFQGVGATLEAAIEHLNNNLTAYWDETYGPEDLDELNLCTFTLDGAWAEGPSDEPELPLEDPPAGSRELEVQDQLNRWTQATMDAYVADYTVHDVTL